MSITAFLEKVKKEDIQFKEVLGFIDNTYEYAPTAFKNGTAYNSADQNQGSAKVFYFARLNGLTPEDTLRLFAEHYQNVLDTPDADNHQNIRQFIQNGWEGIAFEGEALK